MTDPGINLTTEEKLLISLCRLDPGEEPEDECRGQRAESRELSSGIREWENFVRIANENGVIALCWHNLTDPGFSKAVPAAIIDKFHSGYLKSLSRNTLLYNVLEEVLRLARKENIKVILLKGIALEKTVYGNKGLRQMNDIDILVSKNQAIALRNILLKNGFESQPMFSPLHEKILPAYGKHLPEMINKGISTEIHFRLFDQKGNSLTEEIHSKAIKLPDSESDVYYPDPQLFFLYLVKHLDKHEKEGNSQLRLYTDLVVLLSNYYNKIINQQLFKYAIEANIEKALSDKLHILETYWNFKFPEWTKSYMEKVQHEIINDMFLQFLRNPNDNGAEVGEESLLNPMKDIPGIVNKFLYIIGLVFPSLTFMKYRYQAGTKAGALLFYPVRWWKLIRLIKTGRL